MEKDTRVTAASLELGTLLALAGGFQDAYSFIALGGVFANAQTGNIVLLGVEAARGHWGEALRHVPPVLAYVAGVAVAETLRRPRVAEVIRWPARFALVLEIVILAVVGVLPHGVPSSVVVVLIAFTASVQVTTFRTYNTTMVTGNLRTAAQSAYLAIADRDRETARRARNFAVIIGSFVAGAFAGGWLTVHVGRRAIWISAGVLVLALGLFLADEYRGVWRRRLTRTGRRGWGSRRG